MLNILRITALLEGLSFLVLLGIAMPLKYMFDKPEMVRIVGMAHGVLFVAYIVLVIVVRELVKWNLKQTALALIASVLPFGTFYADKKLFKVA
jgi:integral membrane protein